LRQHVPEKFRIEKIYRIEDDINSENEAAIYAVALAYLAIKGFIVNGYSIYKEPEIYFTC